MVEAGRQLVDVLRAASAGGQVVDMNDALLRESIDVIGARPRSPSHHVGCDLILLSASTGNHLHPCFIGEGDRRKAIIRLIFVRLEKL